MISDSLKTMERIQTEGQWIGHELASELLLERQERKGFLQRIVTGDEKCIYFDNSNAENYGFQLDKTLTASYQFERRLDGKTSRMDHKVWKSDFATW